MKRTCGDCKHWYADCGCMNEMSPRWDSGPLDLREDLEDKEACRLFEANAGKATKTIEYLVDEIARLKARIAELEGE